jgi:hypothetical protein
VSTQALQASYFWGTAHRLRTSIGDSSLGRALKGSRIFLSTIQSAAPDRVGRNSKLGNMSNPNLPPPQNPIHHLIVHGFPLRAGRTGRPSFGIQGIADLLKRSSPPPAPLAFHKGSLRSRGRGLSQGLPSLRTSPASCQSCLTSSAISQGSSRWPWTSNGRRPGASGRWPAPCWVGFSSAFPVTSNG